ncbi:MAG TPA: GNAT family N-acetyltransferase [Jatrophihabitans sp.]|nr:GNAT family N-acetyltransferase [Jatrophihabitans sp.]
MSRVNVRVRPATADDVPALVELVQAVDTGAGVFSGKPLQDHSTAHLTERFTEILGSDRTLLVAADDTGAVVGMLAARRDAVGAIDLSPVLHVTHLMVAPGHRRRGIGRSLLAAAVHLADEGGLEHVLTTAAAGSREGNRYLARIGFAPLVVHRIAPTTALRRSLGMTDVAGRMAMLRRARLARAQRAGFASRAVGRGA